MDKIIAYKLKFDTPLHIWSHGVGYEETGEMIHSDTLFSAMMSLWNHFYDDEVQAMCQTPPFLISSAFPFKGNTYFFPRPIKKIGKGKTDDDDPKKGKKLKKVKFISKSLFEQMLNGENLDFDESHTFQNGSFWSDKAEPKDSRVFSVLEIPRVSVDRENYASDIFYFSEVIFEKDSGLFFLARFKEKAMQKKFEAVLRLLGDEGIGGDKRVGKGLFSPERDENFKISSPLKSDSFLTLSLYYPTESEFREILENASYNLVSRRGWLHSPGAMSLKRREVKMFAEGSVFTAIGKDHYGASPCVLEKTGWAKLDHNVYRYGFAFDLPIARGGDA